MTERILLGSEMKLCDKYTIDTLGVPSRTLMERAANGVVHHIMKENLDISNTVVVCGSGNNGGDGFAASRFLLQAARENGIDTDIRTLFVGNEDSMTDECKFQREQARSVGIAEADDFDPSTATLIIDAIFGIGLKCGITGKHKNIIDKMNSSVAFIVSVDIPSGVNSDTGEIMEVAVRADMTVTIAAYKTGLLLYPGAELCGKIVKVDIGIGTEAATDSSRVFSSFDSLPFPLPKRFSSSNKGDYGKVLIIGGAKNMAGAAFLSALAAYRTGAGLVRIFTEAENRIILQTLLPEAVLLTYEHKDEIEEKLISAMSDSTAIVIGPGLSQSDKAKLQLEIVIKKARCPLVIDADALNILSVEKKLLDELNTSAVITPHMGEMSRLTGKSIEDLKRDALKIAKEFAEENGVVCCMKDARTIVSDSKNIYIGTTGNNGMSKGGSGDVLTGIISALLAQKMEIFEAACTSVYLHGKSGDIAASSLGEYSLIARDIADHISEAISSEKG